MTHHFVLMESQPKYLNQFVQYLLSRQYPTTYPNHPGYLSTPNVKEVKLFDIVVPESCSSALLTDLAPYNQGDALIKKRLGMGVKLFQKAAGLQGVEPNNINIHGEWRNYLNVFHLGTKKDAWSNGSELI